MIKELNFKYKNKFINLTAEYVGSIVVDVSSVIVLNADKKLNQKLSDCEDFKEDVLDAVNAEEVIYC